MLSTLASLVIGAPLLLIVLLSVLGTILGAAPLVGLLLLALLAVFVRAGLRLSRDAARPKALRRLCLAASAACALFGLASIPFAVVESARARFEDWHSAGAGLKPGMPLDEARALLARGSVVTELGVDQPRDFKGVRFQVEPTGLAAWKFEFPLGELYYLDVSSDGEGRVAAVEAWHD